MTVISEHGRRELVSIVDEFNRYTADGQEPPAHSLLRAVETGSVDVSDRNLFNTILNHPREIEESLVEASKFDPKVDAAFILFAMHVLYGLDGRVSLTDIEGKMK